MGYQEGFQAKLFYHQINFAQRVPQNPALRKIQEKIDFGFMYGDMRETYGDNGNISIPPSYNPEGDASFNSIYSVRFERELMETIPLQSDWL